MKNYMISFPIALVLTFVMPGRGKAQDILGIGSITGLTNRIIKAIDLKVQRMQNETIWLQNAQKVIENTLSGLKLAEIADWTEKQKEQYGAYFNELAQVKSVIASYGRIREITQKQLKLVEQYKRAWNLLRSDTHFTPSELDYMGKVYAGILSASLDNMDRIAFVVRSFATTMDDAKRLELISAAADELDTNYDDLLLFNRQNMLLSLQRAGAYHDAQAIKNIYGL